MTGGAEGLFELPEEPATGKRAQRLGAPVPAAELPVAKVALESPLPQLDRTFDYLVTEALDATALPGVRVRVRFGGRRLNGWLVDRVAEPEPGVHPLPLEAVVSPEPVLSADVLQLCHDVAERYAGNVADVVRQAVPARVAKVEKEGRGVPVPRRPGPVDPAGWVDDDGGVEFLSSLAEGGNDRVVASFLPDAGTGWAQRLAAAAAATAESGRGSVLVVPDARDLDRLCAALDETVGSRGYARLSADDGPTPRYRSFLRVVRDEVSIVVGTRNAAFAPVSRLGLVAMWDDHDTAHQEPRAPYHHAREVLLLRAAESGCAALFASPARSAEAERLVLTGWARDIGADRSLLRHRAPWVRAVADDPTSVHDPNHTARIPHLAWQVMKKALEYGPVLVQVARTGFVPSLACGQCRTPARCPECSGPLALHGRSTEPVCRWCGRFDRGHRCQNCGSPRLRAGTVGADRTLEELGRSFPGVPVLRSTGADAVTDVGEDPAIVVSTPGVEPVARGGYHAVVLLDADLQVSAEGLRTGEDTLHRWFAAARLARSRDDGGVVVLTGHGSTQAQALVRWDPAGQAQRELAERGQAGLPPAVRCATVSGPSRVAEAFVRDVASGAPIRSVGPTPTDDEGESRWILFFQHVDGDRVTKVLRHRRILGAVRRDPVLKLKVDDSAEL
ncbi:MAG: primosomal protein PriA [Galactobacter sp.]